MAKTIDIVVPDLGDFADVEVIELIVKAGDSVEREDGLIVLETDKASMDVPAPENGTIEAITVAEGDKVNGGDVIGRMSVDAAGDDPGDAAGDTVVINPAIGMPVQAESPAEAPPAADARPKSAGSQTLVVPDIGDFGDVDVIEVHISAGDTVAVEDPLVTLETDKAAMEVPAAYAGEITEVLVSVGDKVSQGSAVALIDAQALADDAVPTASSEDATVAVKRPAPTPPTQTPPPPPSAPAAPRELPPINEAGFARAHASPSVRKLARELGVNLAQVKGTGLKNRVLHDDVKAFVKSVLSGQTAIAAPGAGLPKTPVVDCLQASWINLPHVTQHDESDITQLEARRQQLKGPAKERGIPLTPLAFILKACVAALAEFPRVNSSLSEDGESLVYKKYCHLGFAADTDQGLMVPVIRDADKKDVYELAVELRDLSAAARDGKLKADQLQGATFTISSLGGIGGTAFTPIVNAPEVAILGVSRSYMKPVWDGEKFQPRLTLPLSFSYDHRVIDGAYAVRFTTFLSQALADVDKLLQAIP